MVALVKLHVDSTFNASPEAVAAMHGLRKIDTSSINKYQTDGAKLDYLKQVRARLGRLLSVGGGTYQYDTGLWVRLSKCAVLPSSIDGQRFTRIDRQDRVQRAERRRGGGQNGLQNSLCPCWWRCRLLSGMTSGW